jgi:hypothetical protein
MNTSKKASKKAKALAIEIVLELAQSENIGAYIRGGVIFNDAGCVLYDPEYRGASEKKLWDFAYGE